MTMFEFPRQMIFFGPPGCGKSYRVRAKAKELGVVDADEDQKKSSNIVEATFHPEYGYGDFVAKLLPQTKEVEGKNLIEYRIHAGPVIKALARAYSDLEQQVLLVIDEINRGNCAQIFGDIFQLLDRNDEGWSEYGINPSDLILDTLQLELAKLQKQMGDLPNELIVDDGAGYKLRLPPNLYFIGTMNTSDESVYYMDTAFKRRWNFEYMPWDGLSTPITQLEAKIENTEHVWHDFLGKLNTFISAEFKGQNVDDKQVGVWFLKAVNLEKQAPADERLSKLLSNLEHLKGHSSLSEWKKYFPTAQPFTHEKGESRLGCESIRGELQTKYEIDCATFNFEVLPSGLARRLITHIRHANAIGKTSVFVISRAPIQNKLMFFLWDNVFSRNRTPLHELLKDGGSTDAPPRTFGDFSKNVDAFISGVMAPKPGVVNV